MTVNSFSICDSEMQPIGVGMYLMWVAWNLVWTTIRIFRIGRKRQMVLQKEDAINNISKKLDFEQALNIDRKGKWLLNRRP